MDGNTTLQGISDTINWFKDSHLSESGRYNSFTESLMKLIILGASGFIGRNMVDYFAKKDEFNIIAVSRNRKSRIMNTQM